MICYHDTTFCSAAASCATMDCTRRLTERDSEYADALKLGIAWANFSSRCEKFVLLEETK